MCRRLRRQYARQEPCGLLSVAEPRPSACIISTIGASILLENGVLAAYGPRPQTLPSFFSSQGFSVGAIFFDSQYLFILGFTAVIVTLQNLFFERTLLGKKMQATSQDKEMASLLGIPVTKMIMLTFIYSSALGGLAGILVAPILFVSVGMGSSIALKAFAASNHWRVR